MRGSWAGPACVLLLVHVEFPQGACYCSFATDIEVELVNSN